MSVGKKDGFRYGEKLNCWLYGLPKALKMLLFIEVLIYNWH